MLKIGITGGIGSGKSTVCRIFQSLGVPVYYADDRAKWLMANDPKLIEGIKEVLGEESYHEDGRLNREHIAGIIFNDKSKLESINALVHPAVFEDGKKWNLEQAEKGAAYSMKEAALLFEAGSYKMMDKIIVVAAPLELRLQRVMARDGATEEQVRTRMNKQWPQEDKVAKADFVIENLKLEDLKGQVEQIHKILLGKR